MKRTIFIVMLLSMGIWAQEIKDYDTKSFFDDTDWTPQDTTAAISGIASDSVVGYKYILSTSGAANTLRSSLLYMQGGSADLTLYFKISNLSGTENTLVEIGFLKAPEIGITWLTVGTATSDTTFTYSIAEQSWGPYHVGNQYAVRFTETGNQQNAYAVRARHYKPNR